jgi:single-strand DNA-binding protein
VNLVNLLGLMGDDAKTITAKTGLPITELRIATTKRVKDADVTAWHRVKSFGFVAEQCKDFKKGERVAIVGELQYGSYEKNGQKIYTTDIVAQAVAKLYRAPKDVQDAPSTGPQGYFEIPF